MSVGAILVRFQTIRYQEKAVKTTGLRRFKLQVTHRENPNHLRPKKRSGDTSRRAISLLKKQVIWTQWLEEEDTNRCVRVLIKHGAKKKKAWLYNHTCQQLMIVQPQAQKCGDTDEGRTCAVRCYH